MSEQQREEVKWVSAQREVMYYITGAADVLSSRIVSDVLQFQDFSFSAAPFTRV